jgi:beta-lactamase regulating signal transducer with metallopeptidase domain
MSSKRNFRVAKLIFIFAMCYLWYNPSVHIAMARLFS